MKKKIIKGVLSGCFTVVLAGAVGAQLPSEKAFPLVLRPEVKGRMAQHPPAVVPAVLPSEGKKLPKGAALGKAQLPSSNGAPVVSVAERRRKLPSAARNPAATLKQGRTNGPQ